MSAERFGTMALLVVGVTMSPRLSRQTILHDSVCVLLRTLLGASVRLVDWCATRSSALGTLPWLR